MAVKALVWDLDGTIVDSFKATTGLISKMAPSYGFAVPTQKAYKENYHGPLDETISNAFGGELVGERLQEFVDEFLATQSDDYAEIERFILEDALDLSQRATRKQLKQVVVTNRHHEGRGHASPRSIVEKSAFKEHIHEVICGDDLDGLRKPDPKVLGNLLEQWGIAADELLVIGDQYVDAQLALNLGCKAIIVLRDGEDLVHAHKLDKNWQEHVTIVTSLKEFIL